MPPTLARRYVFKLLANMLSVPVYLVMEALLPRALGPQAYGNYSFATSIFQQFSGFLDMGTSTCFYNALSRRPAETSLAAFYLRVGLLVAALMLFCGFMALWPPLGQWLMPDVPLWFAPMAALWALLFWWSRVLRSMNDALGVTIPSELWRSVISIASCFLLVILFCADVLTIPALFCQQYIMLGVTAAAFWLIGLKYWRGCGARFQSSLSTQERRAYTREFVAYSHPLFAQALLSFFMLTAERWLLQWFDGSAQQGFYALSQKVSMACFLFVSAMTPLLMREFSIAWGKRDVAAMGSLLRRFAPLLYVIAAYFSCFTVAEAATLVEIFGGSQFAAATLPVQIMALYPLHQAYGQMASSIFHASGKTAVLRNITACECVYGLAAAWVLLAPANLYGLNLGATGLAIKTVTVQFASVNLYLWLASRFVPFTFWKNLAHQILSALLLLGAAFLCRHVSMQIDFPGCHEIWRFIFSGLLYSCITGIAGLFAPQLLGLSRQEVRELIVRFRKLDFRKKSRS